jgi:hypothetical protein
MKEHPEDDGVIFFEIEEGDGELEAIDEEGIPSFIVSCDSGNLQALAACLAVKAGLEGRFFFDPIFDDHAVGIGFELRRAGDIAVASVVQGEFPPPPVEDHSEPRAS